MADKDTVSDEAADVSTLQKKRARRRLVGAAALALLAAIVLPMVMDHDPRPSARDIQVRIPSQDAGVLSSTRKASPVPAATSPSAAQPATVTPEPQVPAADVKPEAAAPTAKPAQAEKKPEPKAETKVDTKAETARALRALNGGAAEQWVLQLGAYQDVANVKALRARIKEQGYASYTEKVDTPSGSRIRVRAGPFASREAAQKAQVRLKKIGAGGPPGGVIAKK